MEDPFSFLISRNGFVHVILSDRRERRISQQSLSEILHFAEFILNVVKDSVQNDRQKLSPGKIL